MRWACSVSAITLHSVLLPTRMGPSTAIYRGGSNRFAMGTKLRSAEYGLPRAFVAIGAIRFAFVPDSGRLRATGILRLAREATSPSLGQGTCRWQAATSERPLLQSNMQMLPDLHRCRGAGVATWARLSVHVADLAPLRPVVHRTDARLAPVGAHLRRRPQRSLTLQPDGGAGSARVKATFFLIGRFVEQKPESLALWSLPGTSSATTPGTIPPHLLSRRRRCGGS